MSSGAGARQHSTRVFQDGKQRLGLGGIQARDAARAELRRELEKAAELEAAVGLDCSHRVIRDAT